MPKRYSIVLIVSILVIYSPFFIVFAWLIASHLKRILYLKNNYDNYVELTVNLGTPINVGLNQVKFLIKIPVGGNKKIEIESDSYSRNDIEGNKMLLGYNKEDNSVIFLKSI